MAENQRSRFAVKARWLKKYWIWSFALVGFIVGVPATREILEKVVTGEWTDVNFRHFLLYLVTVLLIGVWLWATIYELDLLSHWLTPSNYVPPTAFVEVVICISLAVLGGLLFLSVKNLSWYIGVFTSYSLFNTFIGIHMLSEVGAAVNSRQKSLEAERNTKAQELHPQIESYERALRAIRYHWVKNLEGMQPFDGYVRHYAMPKWYLWLKNRYFIRLVVTFLASFVAFVISLIAALKSCQTLETLSYWAIVITIIVSEAWIFVWRVRRDTELRKAEELL